MPSSSYFFNAISNTKDVEQFTQGEIDKDYSPYVVNKMVSHWKDIIFFADELNVRRNISKKDQILFYIELIPKKSRRTLWSTKKKNEDLETVMKYYNITQEKADPYLRILTRRQIDELRVRLNTGGRT